MPRLVSFGSIQPLFFGARYKRKFLFGAETMILENKVAIITGAGKGLGRDAALRMAGEGAKVVLVDIDASAGNAALAAVKARGGEGIFITGDVSSSADVEQFVGKTVEQFGQIDILFNNAGIEGEVKPTHEYSVEEFDRVMQINVRGVYLGTKHVIPVMKRQQTGGSIINNSSIAGMVGQPNLAAYVASKHAVVGLTRTAAIEYSPIGIRVNAICPGPIDTEMVASAAKKHNPEDPQQFYDMVINAVPASRIGKPNEVSALVVFLASDLAEYINGAVIPIDGAMTAI